MASARTRLLVEMRESQRSSDPLVSLLADESDIYRWTARLCGPKDSPYEGGEFMVNIRCPPTYPIAPPTVTFVTPFFHPNVNFATGELCLDVLKSEWSPAWSLQFVCHAVVALMSHPNADSPLNCDAGNLIRSGDLRGFRSMARMYTVEFAMPSGKMKEEVMKDESRRVATER